MARPRTELHELLVRVLESVDESYMKHCYFRPPNKGMGMKYPCILYDKAGENNRHADNRKYVGYDKYTLTVIDYDVDSILAAAVSELPFCSFSRQYRADDLEHFVYNLFY